ncbi:MAG: desulfoferrodoxin [Clostridia bacterium]|nr:desulfoferrodoxin [Clostridia bacterium]
MLQMFRCSHCGNIVIMAYDSGVPVMCCGEKMELLVPNTVDAAAEKHVPCVKVEAGKVSAKVGEVEHPMTEEHYIGSIILETEHALQVKWLKHTDKPEAEFAVLEGDKPVAVYEYCTLHGLWKKEL